MGAEWGGYRFIFRRKMFEWRGEAQASW
jgi:hypothetical protein